MRYLKSELSKRIARLSQISLDNCASICVARVECEVFSYKASNKACHLFPGGIALEPVSGFGTHRMLPECLDPSVRAASGDEDGY